MYKEIKVIREEFEEEEALKAKKLHDAFQFKKAAKNYYSAGLNFLKETEPEYAIISVGKDNNFGHPSLRVLDNLRKIKAEVLRTDKKGDIIFESNDQILTLKTER